MINRVVINVYVCMCICVYIAVDARTVYVRNCFIHLLYVVLLIIYDGHPYKALLVSSLRFHVKWRFVPRKFIAIKMF